MAYAQAVVGKNSRDNAIRTVISAWAGNDAAAATAWAQQLPAGQLRTLALSAALGSMSEKDPEAAFKLMMSEGLGNQWRRGGGVNTYQIFGSWADKDPDAATKAAQSLTGMQRSQAMQALASSFAAKDPQAGLTWANALPNGNDKRNAIGSIVSQWANSDVNSAAAWVQQLPEGSTKQSALANLGLQWGQTDPKAALDYARNLTGNAKNSMISSVLGQWAQSDADSKS